eukprot:g5730.t1
MSCSSHKSGLAEDGAMQQDDQMSGEAVLAETEKEKAAEAVVKRRRRWWREQLCDEGAGMLHARRESDSADEDEDGEEARMWDFTDLETVLETAYPKLGRGQSQWQRSSPRPAAAALPRLADLGISSRSEALEIILAYFRYFGADWVQKYVSFDEAELQHGSGAAGASVCANKPELVSSRPFWAAEGQDCEAGALLDAAAHRLLAVRAGKDEHSAKKNGKGHQELDVFNFESWKRFFMTEWCTTGRRHRSESPGGATPRCAPAASSGAFSWFDEWMDATLAESTRFLQSAMSQMCLSRTQETHDEQNDPVVALAAELERSGTLLADPTATAPANMMLNSTTDDDNIRERLGPAVALRSATSSSHSSTMGLGSGPPRVLCTVLRPSLGFMLDVEPYVVVASSSGEEEAGGQDQTPANFRKGELFDLFDATQKQALVDRLWTPGGPATPVPNQHDSMMMNAKRFTDPEAWMREQLCASWRGLASSQTLDDSATSCEVTHRSAPNSGELNGGNVVPGNPVVSPAAKAKRYQPVALPLPTGSGASGSTGSAEADETGREWRAPVLGAKPGFEVVVEASQSDSRDEGAHRMGAGGSTMEGRRGKSKFTTSCSDDETTTTPGTCLHGGFAGLDGAGYEQSGYKKDVNIAQPSGDSEYQSLRALMPRRTLQLQHLQLPKQSAEEVPPHQARRASGAVHLSPLGPAVTPSARGSSCSKSGSTRPSQPTNEGHTSVVVCNGSADREPKPPFRPPPQVPRLELGKLREIARNSTMGSPQSEASTWSQLRSGAVNYRRWETIKRRGAPGYGGGTTDGGEDADDEFSGAKYWGEDDGASSFDEFNVGERVFGGAAGAGEIESVVGEAGLGPGGFRRAQPAWGITGRRRSSFSVKDREADAREVQPHV